jgi:hypothetical protein
VATTKCSVASHCMLQQAVSWTLAGTISS